MCTRSTSWCTGGGGWSGGAGGGETGDYTGLRGGGAVSFISPDIAEVCFVPAANLGDGMVTFFAPNASGETLLAEPPTENVLLGNTVKQCKSYQLQGSCLIPCYLQLHYSARQLRQCQPHRPSQVHVSHVL